MSRSDRGDRDRYRAHARRMRVGPGMADPPLDGPASAQPLRNGGRAFVSAAGAALAVARGEKIVPTRRGGTPGRPSKF